MRTNSVSASRRSNRHFKLAPAGRGMANAAIPGAMWPPTCTSWPSRKECKFGPSNAPPAFGSRAGHLRAVTLAGRARSPADKAVIAAGAWSKVLAAAAGDRVQLETERGYHVVISDPGIAPRYPMMPSDGKMACVMTPQGLRLAGQVELEGLDAAPNWQRARGPAAVLHARSIRTCPPICRKTALKVWMGHRPSTPDGSARPWARRTNCPTTSSTHSATAMSD